MVDIGSILVGLASAVLVPLILAAFYAQWTSPDVEYGEEDRTIYPVILGLAVGNPPHVVPQTEALKVAREAQGIDSVRPVLERIYMNTRIETRHLAVPDFVKSAEGDRLFPGDGSYDLPVELRLKRFREEAIPLVTRVAKEAIAEAGVSLDSIEKLVVVSSTGFLGPGLDCALIDQLGLKRNTDRTLIGFMGCAAAMNGFRVTNDFVRQEKNAGKHALLVCIELSSVHTTFEDNLNDAILHAIFADGCAAVVLGGKRRSEVNRGALAIVDEHSWLCAGTEDGITLAINANGISCTLSKHLSKYIEANMQQYVDAALGKHRLGLKDVDFWGVHPGGTRIIEAVQRSLGLTDEQTADSWAVLGEYGNMLSPSIVYVLKRVMLRQADRLARGEAPLRTGLAFSFSPGVGVEGILIKALN